MSASRKDLAPIFGRHRLLIAVAAMILVLVWVERNCDVVRVVAIDGW